MNDNDIRQAVISVRSMSKKDLILLATRLVEVEVELEIEVKRLKEAEIEYRKALTKIYTDTGNDVAYDALK